MLFLPLMLALAMAQKPVLIAAHRGGYEFGPENTLEGIKGTLDNVPECRAIEFDVQLSSDGVPYLMHDTTIDRTTNGTGPLSALSSAEVDALMVDQYGPSNIRVPKLVDVLNLIKAYPGVVVWAESKSDPGPTTPAIAQAVYQTNFPQRRFFGQWFGPLPPWKQYLPDFAGVVVVAGGTPTNGWGEAALRTLRDVYNVDTIIHWGDGSAFTEADAQLAASLGMRSGPISGHPTTVNATLDKGMQVFLTDWPAACRTNYLNHHWADWKAANGIPTTVTKSTAARMSSPTTESNSLLADYAVGAGPGGARTGIDFQWLPNGKVRLPLGPWPLRGAGVHAEHSTALGTWEDCPREWLDYPLDEQAIEIALPTNDTRHFFRMAIDP